MKNVKDLYSHAFDDKEQFQLKLIGDKIKEGKAILFMGAAVHCPPPKEFEEFYSNSSRPPMGGELQGELAAKLPQNLVKNHSLSWISQLYEILVSRPELIKQLYKALENKKPSPLVKALAKMNFRYIITTNYDNLYEDALSLAGRGYTKGIYKPNKTNIIPEATMDVPMEEITYEKPFLYKIHGDIEDVYPLENGKRKYEPSKDAIVLTDEDYIHFILRMAEKSSQTEKRNYNPIPSAFTQVLADPDDITIIFIGYSLLDYNLRLLFKSALWKKDLAAQLRKWSVDLYPDDTSVKIFEKYNISFIQKNAWSVIPFLYNYIEGKDMEI
jgi:hypothetical protein